MEKMRNILFIAITAVVCSLALINITATSLPGSQGPVAKSYLEGRNYQQAPEITPVRLSSGVFQSEFEQFVADSIPFRNAALFANAGTQRTTIELANIPFGYPAYPTFYDSDYIFCPNWHSIVEAPDSQRTLTPEKLRASAEAISRFIEANQNVNWRMALVDRGRNSLASPAHDLLAQPADYDFIKREYLDRLPSECNYIDLSITDTGQYYEKYFKTDHHWQIGGALDAYQAIMESLGKRPIDDYALFTAYDGPFYGSEARGGLIASESDFVLDVSYDKSALKIKVDGKKKDASFLGGNGGDNDSHVKADEFENVYARYFHGDPGVIAITNESAPDSSSLAIIGDSFTNNIERLFAENYARVYVIDPRHCKSSMQACLDKYQVDDAVFIMGSNTATSVDLLNKLA